MYFPFGWPRTLKVPESDFSDGEVVSVVANRDKIIFAVVTGSIISVWTSRPCLPVVTYERSYKSTEQLGSNVKVLWKPDSTVIVLVTSEGYLIFYSLTSAQNKNLYEQEDPSDNTKLRRESDELFIKEPIPEILIEQFKEIAVPGKTVGCIALFRDEIMVGTDSNQILRYRWDGTINNDYCIDLRRVPFSIDQHASRAAPIQDPSEVYATDLQYSPLLGGFSLVLSDGRAAFLTASMKNYDPNSVQGIWATGISDAKCSIVNHKYRLLSFGRKNGETAVFSIDDQTGGLIHQFDLKLSSRDFPGGWIGAVQTMSWTPDGCAIAISWSEGGFALWSVFGSLLTSSFTWSDTFYSKLNKLVALDWAAEGYQLWMAIERKEETEDKFQSCSPHSSIALKDGSFNILYFVKSCLTANPSMSQVENLYLQGEDRLLICFLRNTMTGINYTADETKNKSGSKVGISPLGNSSNNWVSVQVPSVYLSTNWPVRYTALDPISNKHIAISGRYGLAHYSMTDRRWKVFGNEAQEKDFVVVGGMMWWESYIVVAVYNISSDEDELRFYHREVRLDNKFALVKKVSSQILALNVEADKILVFGADSTVGIYSIQRAAFALENGTPVGSPSGTKTCTDPLTCLQTIDISALCVHPACVISMYLTRLRTFTGSYEKSAEAQSEENEHHSIVVNVSGRLMVLHHDFLVQEHRENSEAPQYITPTVLASSVEVVWIPRNRNPAKNMSLNEALAKNYNPYLNEALWLYCGQEMRVWLPLREKRDHQMNSMHSFITNRIMLGFPIGVYPLAVLFDKAIVIGVENDSWTVGIMSSTREGSYSTPSMSSLSSTCSQSSQSLPYCTLQRTTQVTLPHILRHLLQRNLGYYAWEIARSCSRLPYFPHTLELLLHSVLEEEATTKDPIPDALLPSVVEFVREFPLFLRTVAQCARKSELALWPYLFSVAGRPRVLFEECLQRKMLDDAASYLIVMENLESPMVCRKFAGQLVEKALLAGKYSLVGEMTRFLKSIDPIDMQDIPPRNMVVQKFNAVGASSPPVSPPIEYDVSMVLGTIQLPRTRSLSTSVMPKTNDFVGTSSGALRDNRETGKTSTSGGSTNSSNKKHSPGLSQSGHRASISSATFNTISNKEIPSGESLEPNHPEGSTDFPLSAIPAPMSFINTLIDRRARRLLYEGKLRELGKMAAHLDIHLVSWLRKERKRKSILVIDFVGALKMLHSEFKWPWPESNYPDTDLSAKSHSNSNGYPSCSNGSKTVDSDQTHHNPTASPDDSGYNSTTQGNGNKVSTGFPPRQDCMEFEARVLPQSSADDTLSIVSMESVPNPVSQNLRKLSTVKTPMLYVPSPSSSSPGNEFSGKRPSLSALYASKNGVQMKFLQQIFWEAGIAEWSLLLSICLLDTVGVLRTANSCKDQSLASLKNLRDGILALELWAGSQCLAYTNFISNVSHSVSPILTKQLEAATVLLASNPGATQVSIDVNLGKSTLSSRNSLPLINSKKSIDPNIQLGYDSGSVSDLSHQNQNLSNNDALLLKAVDQNNHNGSSHSATGNNKNVPSSTASAPRNSGMRVSLSDSAMNNENIPNKLNDAEDMTSDSTCAIC